MLRGCQKKIYYVKNTGGKYFEEAYLVLKTALPENAAARYSTDLAAEANRIINEASAGFAIHKKQKKNLSKAVAFILGAAVAAAVIAVSAVILM